MKSTTAYQISLSHQPFEKVVAIMYQKMPFSPFYMLWYLKYAVQGTVGLFLHFIVDIPETRVAILFSW